jgi:hypothetical protein
MKDLIGKKEGRLCREDQTHLLGKDKAHFAGDIKGAYSLTPGQWVGTNYWLTVIVTSSVSTTPRLSSTSSTIL